MPITNPWLAGPASTARLPRERLEERILNLLSSQNMCVLATSGPDGPAATPVRYYSLGLELMFTASPRSPKMRNLRADPRISAGIFAPLVGQASSRGAQLFGTARTLEYDDPAAAPYWEAFRWQSDHVESGRSLDEPPRDALTVVRPDRIVYTEHWLRREGFAARQLWRRG
ncbi:MAG TPA: pyridoxamine 5'-phosphate oxidase family protein [Kribbellaceae bacterium]